MARRFAVTARRRHRVRCRPAAACRTVRGDGGARSTAVRSGHAGVAFCLCGLQGGQNVSEPSCAVSAGRGAHACRLCDHFARRRAGAVGDLLLWHRCVSESFYDADRPGRSHRARRPVEVDRTRSSRAAAVGRERPGREILVGVGTERGIASARCRRDPRIRSTVLLPATDDADRHPAGLIAVSIWAPGFHHGILSFLCNASGAESFLWPDPI